MDESTLKYSALVHEALAYKDSPIYRPTYYKINRTSEIPYEVSIKSDRKTVWTLFGILATVFFVTTVILMCLFVFKVYPIWGGNSEEKIVIYGKDAPILFITGYPGSGMKYPRDILNSYDDMQCGRDEHTIPEFLEKQTTDATTGDLSNQGDVPNYAESFAYVMEALVSSNQQFSFSQPSKSFCSQVPYVLKWASYLNRLLPSAKFLLVIRDPRAIALNLALEQKQELNSTFFTEIIRDWESSVEVMLDNCRELGPIACMPIYFEQLAIHPDVIMPRINDFSGYNHQNSEQSFGSYFAKLDLDAWRENDVIRQLNQSNETLLFKLYGNHKYHQLSSVDLL